MCADLKNLVMRSRNREKPFYFARDGAAVNYAFYFPELEPIFQSFHFAY
jgi:hypothetical protein